jgi:EAL domain-containing protein (putative c-di-GMP-specific phosphodiesterase class I)
MPSAFLGDDFGFASTWESAAEAGCKPSDLVFEVVETEQFPELPRLHAILEAYRAKGARVALDDLGAGHAALAYIQELQPDIIKLDRALLPRDGADRNGPLIDALAQYAHAHGITVLAEGIETEEQLRLVQAIGIDMGQGWLFGRPSQIAQRSVDFRHRRAA